MQYADIIGRLVAYAWIAMMLVWIVSALFAKRYAKGGGGRRYWVWRLLFAVVVLAFIKLTGTKGTFFLIYIDDSAIRWIGAILVFAGIALAIWARFYLGRNWGMPMTEKEGAELITDGPYAYIRNPIYAGVLLGLLGSCLVYGLLWIVIMIPYAAYFLPSIFVEERIMLKLFPDRYPAYRARTKRIIPWIW